jgi:hypothetical protein
VRGPDPLITVPISGEVLNTQSGVNRVEYCVDGGEFQRAYSTAPQPEDMQAVIDASASSGAGASAAEGEAELERDMALADGQNDFSDRRSGGVTKREMAAAGRARRATRTAAKNAEKAKKDAEELIKQKSTQRLNELKEIAAADTTAMDAVLR